MGALQVLAITENMSTSMNIERLQLWVGNIKIGLSFEKCKVCIWNEKFTDNQGNGATVLGK